MLPANPPSGNLSIPLNYFAAHGCHGGASRGRRQTHGQDTSAESFFDMGLESRVMADPVLSVIVLVDSQRERAVRTLRALCAQSLIDRMEILLVDFGAASYATVSGSDHPPVRVIPVDQSIAFGQAVTMA